MTAYETRRYSFKLYPNKAQEAALERQCVLLARLWNAALEQRETQWLHELQRASKGERKGLSNFDQSRQLKFIRKDDPEYRAMSSGSLELCLKALDLSFKAFWRRLKEGKRGDEAGYPRYKSAARHSTIWHRDRSGWKFHQAGKQWRLYAKGIPGKIRARGRFPAEPLEYRTMEIIKRDGSWFASIVVRMEPRRVAGDTDIEVRFTLLDEFATVKNRANGEYLPGCDGAFTAPEERISPEYQTDEAISAEASEELGADGRPTRFGGPVAPAEASEELGADGRVALVRLRPRRAEASGETGADGRWCDLGRDRHGAEASEKLGSDGREVTLQQIGEYAEASEESGSDGRNYSDAQQAEASDIQSTRDKRYKKFSYRWRQQTRRVAKRKAREARRRREALHRWTTSIVAQSRDVLVISPPIREATKSAKGTPENPGAAVATVATINRHILGQAPALAQQMLEYKAAEAGISFVVHQDDEPPVAISDTLQKGVKANRRLRRELKRNAA